MPDICGGSGALCLLLRRTAQTVGAAKFIEGAVHGKPRTVKTQWASRQENDGCHHAGLLVNQSLLRRIIGVIGIGTPSCRERRLLRQLDLRAKTPRHIAHAHAGRNAADRLVVGRRPAQESLATTDRDEILPIPEARPSDLYAARLRCLHDPKDADIVRPTAHEGTNLYDRTAVDPAVLNCQSHSAVCVISRPREPIELRHIERPASLCCRCTLPRVQYERA